MQAYYIYYINLLLELKCDRNYARFWAYSDEHGRKSFLVSKNSQYISDYLELRHYLKEHIAKLFIKHCSSSKDLMFSNIEVYLELMVHQDHLIQLQTIRSKCECSHSCPLFVPQS